MHLVARRRRRGVAVAAVGGLAAAAVGVELDLLAVLALAGLGVDVDGPALVAGDLALVEGRGALVRDVAAAVDLEAALGLLALVALQHARGRGEPAAAAAAVGEAAAAVHLESGRLQVRARLGLAAAVLADRVADRARGAHGHVAGAAAAAGPAHGEGVGASRQGGEHR